MSTNVRRTRIAVFAAAATIPFIIAGCSSSSSTPAAQSVPDNSASMPADSPSMADAASQVFGAGCAAVPTSGAGSFSGMVTAPVASAASANPVLSTLVTAVKAAGLVDTLNSAQGITVFAPANSAFAKIPAAALNSVLANKPELTKILTYHVIAGELSPAQLAGTHKTLEGGTVTVTGSGTDFTVNGTAKVVCGNVPTANATVYIVDSVLMPK
ncbi:MAG TPA: fasciclin domain-containing protein [Candidatus Nanopelagicales bacterium]|jgi:uncharacterized surface protein with fasciclin (FAS1) repeats